MRVLIAASLTDDSSTDISAAAASLLSPPESALRVITVEEKHPSLAELIPGGRDTGDVQQITDARPGTIAASFAAKLQDRGWKVDSVSLEGDPKGLIPERAKDWGAHVIVVGPSDRLALEKFLLVGARENHRSPNQSREIDSWVCRGYHLRRSP